MNYKLALIILLVLLGIMLIAIYWSPKHNPGDTVHVRKDKEKFYFLMRAVGGGMLLTAIAGGIYLYCKGEIKFKAEMPGSCKTCQQYVQRHRGLRPYSVNEYSQLQQHVSACNTCSNMCFDEIQLLQQHEPNRYDLRNKKKSCAETTKHALLARQELSRLESKLKDRQVQYLKAVDRSGGSANWRNVLPPPPTNIPQ